MQYALILNTKRFMGNQHKKAREPNTRKFQLNLYRIGMTLFPHDLLQVNRHQNYIFQLDKSNILSHHNSSIYLLRKHGMTLILLLHISQQDMIHILLYYQY